MIAAILAGGQSRRMGQDKARLCIAGEPLLERTARLAAQAGLAVVVVGRDCPADWCGDPGVRFVPDERPGLGPMGGVHAALRAAAAPVVVLPCDLPHLNEASVRYLAAAAQDRPPRLGLVLRHEGGLEPLFSVYTPACLELLERRMAAGRLSLQAMAQQEGLDLLPAPAWLLPCLRNANTPDDLLLLPLLSTASEQHARGQAALPPEGAGVWSGGLPLPGGPEHGHDSVILPRIVAGE